MIRIRKKSGCVVEACRLGEMSPVFQKLEREHRVRKLSGGTYEVFSRETEAAGSGHGQYAVSGDYVKLDAGGYPYPNRKSYFERNHRHLGGAWYEQRSQPLLAWTADQELCPEIEFLIQNQGLELHPEDPERFFSAILWGEKECASQNDVLILYEISYDGNGTIQNIDFNFVEEREFRKAYEYIDSV